MNGKRARGVRNYMHNQKNKIIADFLTGENKQFCILYAVDCIKQYKLKNRIKIAVAILRGARNG